MKIGLKQFRSDGCVSYLLFDRDTREAAAIDPNLAMMSDYLEYVADHRLKIVVALDTHLHADHFSATHLFRDRLGSGIAMSEKSSSERPTQRLRHGDKLRVGSIEIEALATPGHTPDGMCYRAGNLLFTGDTLFIGSTGRTDFAGADPAQQWDSLDRVLGSLPDDTIVFPGHDYSDLLFSTIGREKKKNPHWKTAGREAFIAMKNAERIPNPDAEIQKRFSFNREISPAAAPESSVGAVTACGIASAERQSVATINVDKYGAKLGERASGTDFVDVREEEEFAEGHMPGARNIPLSEIALHLDELVRSKRVYVSCLSGRRSGMVAKTLSYVGLPDVVNVAGGFKAWLASGLAVEK